MYGGIVIGFVLGFLAAIFMRSRDQLIKGTEEAQEFSKEGHRVIKERISRRKEKVVQFAKKEGTVTNDDVEDMFCIGDSTAGRYLRSLVEEGKLEKVGDTGRGTHYVPKQKPVKRG